MNRDVSDLLGTLMRNQQNREARDGFSVAPKAFPLLGATPVSDEKGRYGIDLTKLRIIRHLDTFVRLLVNEVVEQCAFGIADVMVRHRVEPHLTPELAAAGLDWVVIYVRLDAAENLPFDHRNFGDRLRMIFRALQTEQWGGLLFPEWFGLSPGLSSGNPALLFPFHLHDADEKTGHYYMAEHSRPGRFLRITLEDAVASRLQLKHIAHRVVDLPPGRSFFADIFPTAEKIHQGILHDALGRRAEHIETPAHLPDFFAYLRREGLPRLQQIRFTWPTDDRQMVFLERTASPDALAESLSMLVKEILLLEDRDVLKMLDRGDMLDMSSGAYHIYFDVSRWGACLNVSFDEFRDTQSLDDYLSPMKALAAALADRPRAMEGVRLFIVHHATAEVLGLLKACADAGCDSLATFFVQYAGVVPDAYLETLMSLPPEAFRFYGLRKMETRAKLGGLYILARDLTPLAGLEDVDQALLDEEPDFLDAMRLASGHLFLKEVERARSDSRRMLLVEDGGYLAPLLNRFCLEGRSLKEVFARFRLSRPADEGDMAFAGWLSPVLMGSVEHTRNGYDYVKEVMDDFGRLQFPAVSIALSDLKRGPEAQACAVSILNATENILHRLGLLLARRTVVLLGSAGAIGGFLKKELRYRLAGGDLYGVDIAAGDFSGRDVREAKTLDDLGDDVLSCADLFIGVVGHSVLKREHLEHMMLHNRNKAIFFVSGSTKTVEFSDVQTYLQSLAETGEAKVGGASVTVDFKPLRDLQTGLLQGYEARLGFPENPSGDKTFYLLGELMPINFLYYGIPREIVDEVMAQLFTLSCGMVRREASAEKLPCRLLAVDRDIDACANPLR